jgi:hypothetical protein
LSDVQLSKSNKGIDYEEKKLPSLAIHVSMADRVGSI